MEQNKFEIRHEHNKFINKKRKSFKNTIYFGPIAYLLSNFLFVYALRLDLNISVVIFLFLTILTSIFCIYFPQKAISKLDRIVISMTTVGNSLEFFTITGNKGVLIDKSIFNKNIVTVIDKEYEAISFLVNNQSYNIVLGFFSKNDSKKIIDTLLVNRPTGASF